MDGFFSPVDVLVSLSSLFWFEELQFVRYSLTNAEEHLVAKSVTAHVKRHLLSCVSGYGKQSLTVMSNFDSPISMLSFPRATRERKSTSLYRLLKEESSGHGGTSKCKD